GIPRLEENQIPRRIVMVFGDGVVHTVLVQDPLEIPDAGFLDLNVGGPLVLPQQLLDALLSYRLAVRLARPPLQELTGCRQDRPARQLGGTDGEVDRSVLHIFLHGGHPPFPPASGPRRKSQTMCPPQKIPRPSTWSVQPD